MVFKASANAGFFLLPLLFAFNSGDSHLYSLAAARRNLKEKRDECFGISGVRGNYPQCFLENTSDGKIEFVGLWDAIEGMVECNDIPADVIANNPDIKTFDKVCAFRINNHTTFSICHSV